MDVVPKIDLKLSSTRWSRYSEGRLQISPTTKKEDCRQVFCLWLTPTGSVEELTLILLRLARLQSPRTKYSIAWLEIFRPVTRHCRIWRTSPTFPKTSHPCNVSKSTYKNLHFWTQCQQLNNTAVTSSTAIKFLLKQESRRMKTSTTVANRDLRMTRTNPKYRALIGIIGTWSTSCDFCNCLLFA
jgi:hypothetical protein